MGWCLFGVFCFLVWFGFWVFVCKQESFQQKELLQLYLTVVSHNLQQQQPQLHWFLNICFPNPNTLNICFHVNRILHLLFKATVILAVCFCLGSYTSRTGLLIKQCASHAFVWRQKDYTVSALFTAVIYFVQIPIYSCKHSIWHWWQPDIQLQWCNTQQTKGAWNRRRTGSHVQPWISILN